jgi:peroxiredoxin
LSQYLFENPVTHEVISVIQRMTEPHLFEKDGIKYNRIFISPQTSIDTKINPFSSKEFIEKTGKKSGNLGNVLDLSKELSEKRQQITGKDEIKEKYFESYSKKRKGHQHLQQKKEKLKEELKSNKFVELA